MDRYFNLPVDLEHAMTVAERIERLLLELDRRPALSLKSARSLQAEILRALSTNPDESAGIESITDRARALALAIRVDEVQSDRIGQRVRNLFELIGLGKEGTMRGLECGEDPDSLQRP